jgi:hypothetical protein
LDKSLSANQANQELEADFSREEVLLLKSIREALRGRRLDQDQDQEWLQDIDWKKLVDLAFENRAASLLAYSLAEVDLIPDQQKSILKQFYFRTAQRNLRMKVGLKKILRTLETEGIQVILMKGVALAYSLWPNMALRQMHDIDLMVRREDVIAADRSLRALGFQSDLWEHPMEWYLQHEKNLPYYWQRDEDILVELHFSCFFPNYVFRFQIETFWKESRPVAFDEVPARVFCPEHLLVHLCLHVSCDHFLGDNMRSLMDIALLTCQDRHTLSWDKFVQFTAENRLERLVYFPLFVARKYIGARIDPEYEERISTRTGWTAVERRLLAKVWRDFSLSAGKAEFRNVNTVKKTLRRIAQEILWRREANLATACARFLVPSRGFMADPPSTFEYLQESVLRIPRVIWKALNWK